MLAKDLVSDDVYVVRGSDPVFQVMKRMYEYKVSHLPVLNETEYLGLISEADIRNVSNPEELVENLVVQLLPVSIIENQHVYEVVDLVARYELTLLPVLTSGKGYSGCITLPTLVNELSTLTGAGQPGAIFVLGLPLQDYSPTILSRIIEDNNAKIISLYIASDPNGRDIAVTIKVNTQETGSIIRSFDRYGYIVKSSFLSNSSLDDFYLSRYEEFMKYMNI
jgi:predicted transcriptional regulator